MKVKKTPAVLVLLPSQKVQPGGTIAAVPTQNPSIGVVHVSFQTTEKVIYDSRSDEPSV